VRALLLAAVLSIWGCTGEPIPPSHADQDWVLVFEDDFDGDVLDAAKWTARTRTVRHKQTLNSASPATVGPRGGSLVVSAVPTSNAELPYDAGYIDTEGLFAQTYGKIEFRARCSYAPGLWYAIWGRPWTNAVPELDVEILGENVSQVWFVNHWDLPPIAADERRAYVTVDGLNTTEPHDYTIVWTPETVEWSIDDKPYMRIAGRGVPHEPVFWIINAWVGGWGGAPSASTKFPAELELEHFRIYRAREWLVPPSIRVRNLRERYSVGDAIPLELADFDRGARVEVWEGGELRETLNAPPFRYRPRSLTRAEHTLDFVATDGKRTASTSARIVVY
jgi:beta-glucanase (GH16 family)